MPASIYADAETLQAYLFQCDDNGLYASGADLPRGPCAEGWRFKVAFRLGVHEPVPASIDPEPILRGIRARGYYVWREGLYPRDHTVEQKGGTCRRIKQCRIRFRRRRCKATA
jgi:hypothetical protein